MKKIQQDTNELGKKLAELSIRKFSHFFGFFTCITSLVLAFLFKDYLINLLSYLEKKSSSNIFEFHMILILLYIGVSLPILWGYIICILVCSYVYAFFYGFILVIAYSALGMTISFFVCRYMFKDYANTTVKNVPYLRAICVLIQSNDKGYKIVFLSRLMPLPFGLANALYAVTDVKFKIYIFASVIGLIPSQLILCYMGSTLKSMSDVLANEKTAQTAYLVFVIQLVIAIVVLYYILNLAKIELDKHLNKNPICTDLINHDDLDDDVNQVLIESESNTTLGSNNNNNNSENCQLLNMSIQN